MPFPKSSPDPLNPTSAAATEGRLERDISGFETDLADLAARFSAQSGGGLSAELSADLALEVVLNEIVEQACLATGATGAAIVLQRDEEFVCRASSGVTAPELGSRLDRASGLSGECLRTGLTQRCDDVLADLRADVAASHRLGVRSVMIVPITRDGALAGVFELFSSLPYAFGERDERTVEALVGRTLRNVERADWNRANWERTNSQHANLEPATVWPERQKGIPPVADFHAESLPSSSQYGAANPTKSGSEAVTWVLRAAVLACAILLGVVLGRHLTVPNTSVRARPATTASIAERESGAVHTEAGTSATAAGSASKDDHVSDAAQPAPRQPAGKAAISNQIAPGSLVIFANGREVFHLQPAQNKPPGPWAGEQDGGMEPAASVEPEGIVELSPAAAEDSLVHRVEPQYPDEARQQQIQGPVVLSVRIAPDGAVQELQVVSGAPQLAGAAAAAVRQWRFAPHLVNGRPVEMQTEITLNFRLPQ